MTETDLAYTAGLFDGEGTFAIYKMANAKDSKGRIRRRQLRPQITIANTDADVLIWLSQKLESLKITNCYLRISKKSTTHKHKTGYVLTISSLSNIAKLTHALLPYLRIKIKHAKILLEFVKLRIDKINRTGRHDLAKYDHREFLLHQRSSILNKKGMPKCQAN